MKSLVHNGIYVPPYDYKGFTIKIQGHALKLSERTEPMAVAWVRRTLSTTIAPPDTVFKKNFMKEFLEKLMEENPQTAFLNAFVSKYLVNVDDEKLNQEMDFNQIKNFILDEKAAKEALTKEIKKQQAEERKIKRLELKEKLGYAAVDDQKLEIANWTAEPSCLFAGRGDHPQRGKWKEGPSKSDITLNISSMSDEEAKKDGWAGAVWEKNKMYVASWKDKLTGKIKYVWFSDTAFLKQNREKEKFQKAETLGKQIKQVEHHILKNLNAKDELRRKVATVSWLILVANMRVGDEKDPDEADTVGAITLRSEHVTIEGNVIHFDFLGKDSVRWVKNFPAPPPVIKNMKAFKIAQETNPKIEYLFQGVDSRNVSRFLSEKMPKLTAKVFRTWRCTKTVREELEKSGVTKKDPDYKKSYAAKIANYKVAEVANHKRKIPPTFDARLAKKQENLKKLEELLIQKKKDGKKTESLQTRIEKAKLDIELTKLTKEYNLGTSLKSYIDPNAYVKWAKKVKFDIEKFYPKTLRSKFNWAIKSSDKSESECITP
ncbi:MAG: DNA topoisomerase I [Candidatus Bathyarchaeota archaeon]|nr:DNA topoisomerase I [Candidatus Bathyarchaeota archaeon]